MTKLHGYSLATEKGLNKPWESLKLQETKPPDFKIMCAVVACHLSGKAWIVSEWWKGHIWDRSAFV